MYNVFVTLLLPTCRIIENLISFSAEFDGGAFNFSQTDQSSSFNVQV